MSGLVAAVQTWALHLVIVSVVAAPAAVFMRQRRVTAVSAPGGPPPDDVDLAAPALRPALLAAASTLVVWVAMFVPMHHAPLDSIPRYWQANTIALVVCTAIIALAPGVSARGAGLGAPRRGSWRPVVQIGLGAIVLQLVIGPMSATVPTIENVLFQLTVSNVFEELWFRGVLWVFVAAALPGAIRIGKVRASWALAVTSVLFGLVHGVVVEPSDGLVLNVTYVVTSGIAGVVLGWLRERADSIWPPVVLHTIINLSGMFMTGLQA